MEKIHIKSALLIFLLILINACSSDESIKGYKASEILVVTVNIDNQIEIEKIVLDFEFKEKIMSSMYAHYYDIVEKEVGENKIFKLKIPLKDLTGKNLNGSHSICIYTTGGEIICSDKTYCSGGDRTELTLKNGTFITISKQRRHDLLK